jgi:threonine synthase
VPHALVCAACGATHGPRTLHAECPACGGLLDLVAPAPDARGAELRARFDARRSHGHAPIVAHDDPAARARASGVWRFRELVLDDATDAEIVSQPEGDTPLLHRTRSLAGPGSSAAAQARRPQPDGSFKDRG